MAGFFRSLVRHHSRLVSGGRTVGHKNGPEASGPSAGAALFRTDLGAAAVYLPRSRRYKLTITTAALAAGLLLQANNAPPVLAAQSIRFSEITSGHPFENLTVGENSAPALVDIDNDGDLDAFVGEYYGAIMFFRNTGSAANPVFVEETATNPLAAVAGLGLYNAVPALADIDHDGDLDAFVGEYNGTIKFFRNTGSAANPVFVEETVTNPLAAVAGLGLTYSAPALVDIDHDGDLDAFVGGKEYNNNSPYGYYGTIKFFRNTGNDSSPAFAEETGSLNPLDAVAGLGLNYTVPALVDIDQDGDLDAFIGANEYLDNGYGSYTYGTIKFFRNSGNDSSPVFVQQTGVANPFDGNTFGTYPVPAFGDLNGDGRREAVVGQGAGPLAYFVRLDPREPPAAVNDPGSAMFTLEDVYYRLKYGNDSVKRSGAFVGPNTGPQPSGFTLEELMKRAPQPLPANDSTCARPADVNAGQWFWSTCVDTWGLRQGTK